MAKNFLSVGFANIISQFFTFFTIAYYARIISVESFGRISLAQSILVYFTMITLFGFQTYGQREIAKDNSKAEQHAGNILVIRLIISILCFLVIFFISSQSNKGIEFKNILIIYGLTIFPLVFNLDWLYSGLYEMQYNAVYNILKNVIPFLIVIIFLKSNNDVYVIPFAMLVGSVIAVLYHVCIFKFKEKYYYRFSIDFNEYKKYIVLAFPFLISGILSMINCNIDSIIIGFLRSERELGIYSSAYKIVFFLTNLMRIVFIPIFPLIVKEYNNNNTQKLNDILNKTSKLVILLAVPICVGGISLSKEIIILLFGYKYKEAYITLIILCIYVLILFMRETYAYSLNAFNMEKKYLYIVAISSLVNLVLNLVFIPNYGINAAAVVTVISEIINFIFMKKYCNKVVSINYRNSIVKVALPNIIMLISILIGRVYSVNTIIILIYAIVIYFVSIILFRYISINEIKKMIKGE